MEFTSESFYGSPPTKPSISLTDVSWLLDMSKDGMKNVSRYIFGSWKGLSNDDVGVARGTVFKEIWPWAGYNTSDFVQEKLEGLPQNDS